MGRVLNQIINGLMRIGCGLWGHGPVLKCRDWKEGSDYYVCLLCSAKWPVNEE